MSGFKRLAIIAFFLGNGAAAEGFPSYRLINPKCDARVWQGGKWLPAPIGAIETGTVLTAIAPAKPGMLLRLRLGKSIYAIAERCLARQAATARKTTPPAPKSPPAPPGRWYVGLFHMAWQESYTLTAPDGTVAALAASFAGTQLALGRTSPLSERFELDFRLGIVAANASARYSSLVFTYDAPSTGVIGFTFVPSVYWRPTSGDVSLGLGIPLLYRQAAWPDSAPLTLDTGSTFFGGAQLDTRFHFSQSVAVSAAFGLVTVARRIQWSVGLLYSF